MNVKETILFLSLITAAASGAYIVSNEQSCSLIESEEGNPSCVAESTAPTPSQEALKKAQDRLTPNRSTK